MSNTKWSLEFLRNKYTIRYDTNKQARTQQQKIQKKKEKKKLKLPIELQSLFQKFCNQWTQTEKFSQSCRQQTNK